MDDVPQRVAIFIGVLSSDVGASNSIRNKNILRTLNKDFAKVVTVDFGRVSSLNSRILKLLSLTYSLLSSVFAIVVKPQAALMISTNPKWLVLIAIVVRRKFTLYLGDPFSGDVSRDDRCFYDWLWKACIPYMEKIIVFSPFLHRRLREEHPDTPIDYCTRDPMADLPSMVGSNILYLGDFSSKDRDFSSIIAAVQQLNLELHLYGRGDYEVTESWGESVKIFERRPLSGIYEVIPKYSIMLIVLNRKGDQVPGKLFDFAAATFPVLVLYQEGTDLKLLPNPRHYVYCLNAEDAISAAIHEIQSKSY